MSTAVIVYRSATGTTRGLAEEIGAHLGSRGVDVAVHSVGECDPASLAGADIVLLGCWTSGYLVVGQHPDEPWLAFVRDLPTLGQARVGLFTTYKLATGSMFRRMRAALGPKVGRVDLELKSRDRHLPRDGRAALDRFIGAGQP
jgi:flavodoxin